MKFCFRFLVYLFAVVAFSSASAESADRFFTLIIRDDPTGMQALLNGGFDPNTRNDKGQHGLGAAIHAQSMRVADVLARHPRVDLDAENAVGETALMFAALRGDRDWVQRLLDAGAKVHKPGWSPIHYAATGPDARIVELLLDRGAPTDSDAPRQMTPLMMAARFGTEDSVRLLVARGADLKRRNDVGMTAIDFARGAGRERLAAELERVVR